MTKSNRHKKQRRQEKAKTQLTGVKKLSKAKNVVQPTLRVKKILIREQLKLSSLPLEELKDSSSQISDVASNVDTAGTRWKRSVQELIASSNHHNISMRKEAIIGLQDIAASKSSLIIRNLDKLLGRIAALTSDQESVVRKENTKLAASVISMVSYDQLAPFWSMLMAHLKCTMTHLDVTVRYSAVAFIEILVDHHPVLVYESISVLLPSLLGLISTTDKSNSADRNAQKQKNVTKLKTEITTRQDEITVRIKVLSLLSKCMNLPSPRSNEKSSISPPQNFECSSLYLNLQYPYGYNRGHTAENQYHSRESSSGSYADRFYASVTGDPFNSAFNKDSLNNVKQHNNWYEFVNSCIYVLIETWVEVGPSLASRKDQSKDGKRRNKDQMESKMVQIGNDKDGSDNIGRRYGLHILNEQHCDSVLSIVTLLEQLLQKNGMSMNFKTGDVDESNQLIKDVKNAHAKNLSKYFFGIMPYESLKESKRKDVITVNLKLFLIAGKLKLFDNSLKKKLHIFIEGVLERSKFGEDHCKLILNVMKFLDMKTAHNLSTRILVSASKMGYHQAVTGFLTNFLHPASFELQTDNNLRDMVADFKWNEIILEVVNNWPVSVKLDYEGSHRLFELLTYITLRKLTDINFVLQSCISKFKELVMTLEIKPLREIVHRTFFYAGAERIFDNEFAVGSRVEG